MRTHARYILPLISLACFVAATIHVAFRRESQDLVAPPIEPMVSPFTETIAACGIVEPRTENVEVSSTVAGVVRQVAAAVGEQVNEGQLLFCLDDRQLQADLQARQADLRLAESELAVLNSQPRAEEVAIAETRLRNAEARLLDSQDEADRMSKLSQKGAVSHRDVVHVERLLDVAHAVLDERNAELQLLAAGASQCEQEVKRRQVECAKTRCRQVETEIERLRTRAPIAGEVLQVNIRPGEFINVPPLAPPVVLGDTRNLHIRVDIDEFEIARFDPNARAVAAPRGSSQNVVSLTLVRVEPYVIPKQWVSGFQHQIIDTRVLQVIYRIVPQNPIPIFVGQQVDVHIDAEGTECESSTQSIPE